MGAMLANSCHPYIHYLSSQSLNYTAPSAPPDSVGISAVTSSSITVQWEMVPCIHRNGDITGYLVQYTRGGSTQTVSVSGDSSGGMVTISGLSPITMYLVQVAAVNSAGTGDYSDSMMISTPESEYNMVVSYVLLGADVYLNSQSLSAYMMSSFPYYIAGVYLSLRGDIIPNHGYVMISDIGYTVITALLCHTNRSPPYDGRDHSGGEWLAPDGIIVYQDDVPGFAKNRDPMVLRLYRVVTGTPAEGIYHCVIEDDIFTTRTVFVGLYNGGGGKSL